tara:strand:- start:1712 stop:2296 length:585 start_codon:yes stop_codon:yes gene_type:complete
MVGPTTFGYQNLGFGAGGADAGQLELLRTQTISSNVSAVEFTSLQESIYKVHLLTLHKVESDADNKAIEIGLSNDSGSSYETSNYHWAWMYMKSNGTFTEKTNTSGGDFTIVQNIGNNTAENFGGYVYLYNLGESSQYSNVTWHGTGMTQDPDYISVYGSGTYHVAETVNALRIKFSSDNVASGVFSLYGVKGI